MYRRGQPTYFYQDPIVLSDHGAYPSIAADHDNLHVVYMTPPFSWGELYYVRSKDEGKTWEAPVYLTYAGTDSYPSIAAAGQTIHVVWKDGRHDKTQIYYKRSDDGGDNWSDDMLLSNGVDEALNPSIAVRENEVHVAWTGELGIQYLRSIDGGQHWTLPVTLSEFPFNHPPSITVSESVVAVCWTDTIPQHAELVLRRSTDSGNTWEDEVRLFPDEFTYSNPNIASEGNVFALVWNVMVNGNWTAVASFSPDQGNTWTPPYPQFTFTTFAFHPFVTVHEGNGHMICWDKSGSIELAYDYQVTDFPFFSNNELDWGYRIGGNGSEYPNRMIKDDAGNLYITGKFSGTVDFDPGPATSMVTSVKLLDIFVAKYNSSAQLLWVKSMGGMNHEGGSDIALDHDGNIYIAGEFGGTVDFDPGPSIFNYTAITLGDQFLVKLDPDGNFVWAKHFGYSGSHNTTILAISSSDQVIIGGTFRDSGDFDPSSAVVTLTANGEADVFILALDLDGNFSWARSYGGAEREAINDIEIDNQNNILITGEYLDSVDFDPGPGAQFAFAKGGRDVYLLKLNQGGNFEKVFTTGSTGYDSGETMEWDGDGNLLFFGEFSKTIDIDPGSGITEIKNRNAFLAKLDPDWNLLWVKTFAGEFGYQPPIRLDSLQNIYILTYSNSIAVDPAKPNAYLHSGDEDDVFLLKLSPEGNFVWVNQFHGNSYSYARDLVVQGHDLYCAGYFESNLDIDPSLEIELLQSVNDEADMFIMKIGQCGPVYNTINITRCEAYDVPNSNEIWTVSGIYHRHLTSPFGCDSLLKVNLTILPSSTGSEMVTECDQFISPSGATWNASGIYQDTLTNVLGCDSVVIFDLTILSSSASVIDIAACNEFTSPDGDPTLTSTGSFQETYANAVGCDSIVTYNVTIAHDAIHEYEVSACDSYTTPDGLQTWTQGGIYSYHLPTTAGCDSMIIVYATITSLDNAVLELGQSLKAQQGNASYQWIDCGSGLPVAGANYQEFYPSVSGIYRVVVAAGGCLDTSACYTVVLVGTHQEMNKEFKVFPNPANSHVQIDLGRECKEIGIRILDIYGKLVSLHEFSGKREIGVDIELVTGLYVFEIKADERKETVKVVVE